MHTAARPDHLLSGLLALVVHLAFLGFLVIGLSWQRRTPEPVVAELWQELPRPVRAKPPQPALQPRPQPVEAEPSPPPPKPEPRVERPPEPATAKPPVEEREAPKKAPDIALKDKRAEEKKLREQKLIEERQKREEMRRQEEARKAEERRAEDERARLEAERRRDEEARRRAEQARQLEDQKRAREAMEAQTRLAEEQRRLREAQEAERRAAAKAAAQAQKTIEEFRARIAARIRDKVVVPPGVDANVQAEFEVKLLQNGTVAAVRLTRSSGVPAYDRAVERAIDLAQPLPTPDDPEIFQEMRDLKLVFRPRD